MMVGGTVAVVEIFMAEEEVGVVDLVATVVREEKILPPVSHTVEQMGQVEVVVVAGFGQSLAQIVLRFKGETVEGVPGKLVVFMQIIQPVLPEKMHGGISALAQLKNLAPVEEQLIVVAPALTRLPKVVAALTVQ
jgi:hypothetical protein